MVRKISGGSRRVGFTLIELLVVIAIIAILASLTSYAVMKAYSKGPEVKARNDMSQLAQGLEAFKTEYGVYPPSRLRVCSLLKTYTNTPSPNANGGALLDTDSIKFLKRIAPKITNPVGIWSNAGINWNGNFDADVTLEGDQCLVFALGGIQTGVNTPTPGCLGFASDPLNPASTTAGARKTFFDFKPKQLQTRGNNYLFYTDPIKNQPYLYFSNYMTDNNYSKYVSPDCPTAGFGPVQLAPGPPIRYQNPLTYQLICAGTDGKFGTADDMTNFK